MTKSGIRVKFDIKPEIYTTIPFNEIKKYYFKYIKNSLEQAKYE